MKKRNIFSTNSKNSKNSSRTQVFSFKALKLVVTANKISMSSELEYKKSPKKENGKFLNKRVYTTLLRNTSKNFNKTRLSSKYKKRNKIHRTNQKKNSAIIKKTLSKK